MAKYKKPVTRVLPISDTKLKSDLERYRKRAIELGAVDAKVITSDMVVFDERARAKCIWPKCIWYGTNPHCPPYTTPADFEFNKKVVAKYAYGIFLKTEMTPEETFNEKSQIQARIKLFEIVSKLESDAYYDGYYWALAFGCGPCKGALCIDKECSALVPGQGCRYYLKARISMEGAGMDVFSMATKVGWDVCLVGTCTKPSEIPYANRMGLVLII